jgi:hypothetical protein
MRWHRDNQLVNLTERSFRDPRVPTWPVQPENGGRIIFEELE